MINFEVQYAKSFQILWPKAKIDNQLQISEVPEKEKTVLTNWPVFRNIGTLDPYLVQQRPCQGFLSIQIVEESKEQTR